MRSRRHEPDAPGAVAAAPVPVKWLEEATHRKLTVHTAAQQSFSGILRLATDDGLLLWHPVLLGTPPVQLEGEVFIPKGQVLFVQTERM